MVHRSSKTDPLGAEAVIRKLLALTAVTLCGIQTAHGELLWNYSYSGSGISESGYMTTSGTLVGGAYSITGVSGIRNGQPVESLLAAGTYAASGGGLLISDNLLYPATPMLGLGGFTVRSGNDLYNVYNLTGQYLELAGANCPGSTCGQPGFQGTPIVFSANEVPELLWQFSYSGAGVSASGYLTTLADLVDGAYQIVGVTGTRDGDAMNSLFPAGTYSASGGGILISDNLLFPDGPYLGLGGFTFHAGSDRYNIYYQDGQYYELAGADCGGTTCGQPGHVGTPITFSLNTVPEPNVLALLCAMLPGIGWAGQRKLR